MVGGGVVEGEEVLAVVLNIPLQEPTLFVIE